MGLAWRDVDLDQRVLAVRQTLQYRPGEGFHLVPPKTARSRRIVPLPDAVVDALKLRREQQETDRLAAGVEFWDDWGLVFTTRFGTPLSPRNGYRDFQRLVGAAGLRPVRLLSRPGAQCRCCHRSVSPGRSPNPSCQSLGNGLSTVAAVRRGSWAARGWGSGYLGRCSEKRLRPRSEST